MEFTGVKDIEGEKRLTISFPYSKEKVQKVKSTDWAKTKYQWHPKKKVWSIVATKSSFEEFEDKVREIPEKYKKESVEREKVELYIPEDSTYFYINNLPSGFNKILREELSYQVQGYQFTDEYRNGSWDGREVLYSDNKQSAPIGMVNRVKRILNKHGLGVEIVDKRKSPEMQVFTDWNPPGELRDYQKEAVKEIIEKEGGIVSLPTGSGKTLIAMKVINRLSLPTIVLVHRKELLYQWQEKMKEVLGIEAGLVGDGMWKPRNVTVAMVQSLHSKGIPNIDFDVMVGDEVHKVPADTVFDVSTNISASFRVGLSATPFRNDNKDMKIEAAVGDFAIKIGAERLIEEGYLAEPKFEYLEPDGMYHFRSWPEAEEKYIVHNTERNRLIAEKTEELIEEGHKILVDVHRINHGRMLEEMIDKGVFVCGEDSTERRKELLNEFKEGERRCLISTLLEEGVDLPSMSSIILAGGGKSNIQTIQTIGRALRPKNGGKAVIVDCKDKGDYVGKHYRIRRNILEDYYGKYFNII